MKLMNCALLLLLFSQWGFLIAQDHEGTLVENTSEGKEEFKHHYLGFSIGHTHVATGLKDCEDRWLALPSFGISYAYAFNPRWAIALHNEIIV